MDAGSKRDDLLDLAGIYGVWGTVDSGSVPHISSDLESLCDDLYMIDDGKIHFTRGDGRTSGKLRCAEGDKRAVRDSLTGR